MSQNLVDIGLAADARGAISNALATLLCTSALLAGCDKTSAPAQVERIAVENKTSVCPSRDFKTFLVKFASDAKVREAFTAPVISVVDYENPDSPERGTTTLQVPKDQYVDFTLAYQRGAFHNVDASGQIDPAPVEVAIEKRGDDYYVSYLYGMSEGNSWLFKPIGQCWILSEDPEPPSP